MNKSDREFFCYIFVNKTFNFNAKITNNFLTSCNSSITALHLRLTIICDS